MARAFRGAVEAAALACEAGPAGESLTARASSPLTGFLHAGG
jgi:thiazole synthase ThiGH ThiG subunit